MNYKKILPFLISSAFLFAACGDDSSSTSADPSTEESSESQDSSSSKDGSKSSSSKKVDAKSSSSTKSDARSSSTKKDDDKSSSSTPQDSSEENSSAPKLEDLEKNYELKLFDHTVYLSTGSKQGVFALRIPDELWVVTYTDFAGGVVSIEKGNSGVQYSETDAAKKIVEKVKEGFKISFVVKETDNADEDDTILYSVDGGDYSEAVKASVAVQKGKVSKADSIKNKIYECADGDTTRVYRFFDGSYIYENSVGDKVVNWHAGRYDIQRSTLLMIPFYYVGEVRTLFNHSVGTDNTITKISGGTLNCTVEGIEYEYEKAEDFVGEWVAKKDGLDWTFTLTADGTSKLEAREGTKTVERKSGTWEIYGYYMVIDNNTFLNASSITTAIYGQLQTGPVDRETGKISGFSFIHNDPDTPHIPTSFDAPEYDD